MTECRANNMNTVFAVKNLLLKFPSVHPQNK